MLKIIEAGMKPHRFKIKFSISVLVSANTLSVMLSTINLYCALICCAFVFVLKYLLLNKACSVKSIFLGLGSYVNNTIIKNLNQYWEVL